MRCVIIRAGKRDIPIAIGVSRERSGGVTVPPIILARQLAYVARCRPPWACALCPHLHLIARLRRF
ncbi:hypothetical protein KCP76_15250 [Salmonella enterica subsp. enterica serovar Weltevreden]|nr:hypothetical protein KCP76_15250 [Salmonella enterica subsp. enterica serovar Weltevreden]